MTKQEILDYFSLIDFAYNEYGRLESLERMIDELLKEQEAMNVDAFVQWCINSHIMGDATVSGIKYWVGKYKEIK